jgi:hypothetical protein
MTKEGRSLIRRNEVLRQVRNQDFVMSEKITLGLTQEQSRQLLMLLREHPSYHNALAEVYAVLKMKIEKGPRQDRANPPSLTSKQPPL